jgi:hypothetical protein
MRDLICRSRDSPGTYSSNVIVSRKRSHRRRRTSRVDSQRYAPHLALESHSRSSVTPLESRLTHTHSQIRVLALVLLRSKSFTTSVTPTSPTTSNPSGEPRAPFDNISEKERERVEACLMSALRDEFDGRVRRAVGEVVGRWARESGKRGRESEFLMSCSLSWCGV